MQFHATVERWRHPAFLIFLLGGFLGAAINIGVTVSIYSLLPSSTFSSSVAFFLGTFLNQAFHYVYYHVVYVNREIRMRTSFSAHFLMTFSVSMGSALLLWFFMSGLFWPFFPLFSPVFSYLHFLMSS
jgi:hypothetical protein